MKSAEYAVEGPKERNVKLLLNIPNGIFSGLEKKNTKHVLNKKEENHRSF